MENNKKQKSQMSDDPKNQDPQSTQMNNDDQGLNTDDTLQEVGSLGGESTMDDFDDPYALLDEDDDTLMNSPQASNQSQGSESIDEDTGKM